MKSRLPGDFEGGLLLFTIIFGIALAELYFIKKRHAYLAKRTGNATAGAVTTQCPLINNLAAALNRLFNNMLGSRVSPLPVATTPTPTQQQPSSGDSGGGCNPNLWQGIAQPARLQNLGCVTVTGQVVGVAPHYPSDGDMVFSLRPDPEYEHLLTEGNRTTEKMDGGIWCEAICQHENVSTESWHQGDCEQGGPFPKFPLPSIGDRMRVTGIHTIDNGEGEYGQAEIHPISAMSKI
jgi:hypothetical protein